MAEENNEVIDIPTGEGTFTTVPIVSFEKGETDFLTKTYGADKAESAIAENVAEELSLDFPNLFNYKQLRDGTAPLFDFSPDTKSLDPSERSMTDKDILDQFTNLKDVGFFEGLTRELTKMAPSAAGGYAGVKLGAKATSMIPPTSPLTIGVKYGVPVITGLIGAFKGYRVGDEFTDLLLGPEKAVTPSQSAAYESGKTVGGGLAWLPMPFLVPKNISMGAATYLDNLDDLLAKGPQPQKISPEGVKGFSDAVIAKALKTGKGPKAARISRAAEQLLGKIGTEFSKRPKTMGAAELTSVLGSGTGAYLAETADPGGAGTRFISEVSGGILPQIGFTQLLKYIPEVKATIKEAGGYKNFFKESFQSAARGFGENRQLSGARRILEILETQGEDVDGLIEALNSKEVVDLVGDLDLTAAQKTGNTTLMAIENSIAQSTEGLAKQAREKNKAANQAIRKVVFALSRTGNPELIKAAAKIQEGRFNQYLSQKLINSTEKLLEARSKLKGEDPKNNKELSRSLFELTGNQLNKARDEEKRLYRDIANVEITSFVNTQGNPTDTPRFISYFDSRIPDTKEAADYIRDTAGLKYIQNFVERKRIELGLEDVTPGATSNRVAEFDKIIESIKAKGTQPRRTDNLVLNVVDQAREDLDFGDLESLDAGQLTTLLERIRSNPPQGFGDAFKGQTRDAMKERTRLLNNQRARHKDAMELVNTYRKRKVEQSSTTVAGGEEELKPLTVTELRDMRSIALANGRKLAAAGDDNGSSFMYGIAEAILDDLENAPEGVNQALDIARSYSKALNDVYTRAFAGNVLAKSKTGAQRQSPELLHKNLMTADADVSYLRIKQIEDIGNFAKEQGIEGAEETISTINGTLDSILRNARSEVFTETPDGEVILNQKKLQDWMNKNEELLEAFPTLKSDLENTVTANNLLRGWVTKDKNIQKNIKNQITYRNLTKQDNPTAAVSQAFNSKFPIKSLNSLVKPAKGNEEALAGLKSSILEWALTKGGKTSESFSPREVYQTLYTKIPNSLGDTSIMDHMLTNNVIKKSEANSFKKLLTEMIKLEASEVAGTLETVERAGPIIDFYLRVTGSAIGTRMQGLIPGQTGAGQLVAAGAGSKALRRIFEDIPASMKTDVMTEVMENPRLLATLLKKAKTEPEKLKLSKRLKQLFTEAGFFVTGGRQTFIRAMPSGIRAIETEEYDPTAEDQTIGDQSSVEPRVQEGFPTTQVTSSQPFLSGLNTASAGGGGSSATSAPTDRTKYASLFPTDIVSSMIPPTATMAEGGAVPPREIDIKGQPHMLAYITPQEGGILQLLGGSGKPGPMGIPSFYGPGGPGDDGSNEADPSGAGTESPSSGGDTGYSGSISDAMADSSPTGMTGIGGIGGYGPSSSVGSTNIGLDDSIAAMADVMGGLSKGVSGLENMQGSVTYAPVKNVPYDIFGLKNKMNKHARQSLKAGVQPSFSKDALGNITSVTGPGGSAGLGLPTGIVSLAAMIGNKLGVTTTTGYNQKDTSIDGNGNGNDNFQYQPVTPPIKPLLPVTPQTVFDQNPNQYTLNILNVANSLRNR
jgi:hypothetical protein